MWWAQKNKEQKNMKGVKNGWCKGKQGDEVGPEKTC